MSGGVALTFDDGPDPVWTPRVLDALADAGARATFFVVAPLAERHAPLVRKALEEGHEIGFHCTRHVRHDRMSADEILADAADGLRALARLGLRPAHWRVPWGLISAGTVAASEKLGLRLVGWTADSEDWRGDEAVGMLARLRPGIGPDAVVLMHDAVGPGATREGCAETVALVAPLVEAIRSRGLETVTAGKLAGHLPAGNPGSISGV